jgi:hypothetical protein
MTLDVDACISTLRQGECVSEKELRQLCQYVSELLMEESNVQPVLSPVTVVGDLHGQFFDLLNLLTVGGWPPQTSYIFLGDFVDRGHNSVETLSLLLCLKFKYPGHVTLLRGNHEVSVCLCCVSMGGGSYFLNIFFLIVVPFPPSSHDKSHKYMDFMTNVCANMGMLVSGDIVYNVLIALV